MSSASWAVPQAVFKCIYWAVSLLQHAKLPLPHELVRQKLLLYGQL